MVAVLLLLGFGVSLVATLFAVRSARNHAHITGDHDLSGPQKFHQRPVPRIGGLGIFVGFLVAAAVLAWRAPQHRSFLLLMALSALPAFGAGLLEDLTKRVSATKRLVATAASAALGAWWLGAVVSRLGAPWIDALLVVPLVAAALAVFAVAGVANSVNIIDGMNGLASMSVVLMLAGLAYVASEAGDALVVAIAVMTIGATLGFFLWNYPSGLIFLGDGGAYFLGFMVAELGILLVHRNPEVSPFCPLLICAYPIVETLFSMYRRKVVRGRAVAMPDGIHLHSLIYRRLMRWAIGSKDAALLTRRNSATAPYLWVLCAACIVPALFWWDSTPVMLGSLAVFCGLYVKLYARIVRFRTPRVLVRHSRPQQLYSDVLPESTKRRS